ncbi:MULTISPECIES: YcsE-related riboflavin metabolism phosphatase [unclassified Mycoplasma]|uniref:YcsE-related riboflavin metabolism phosphatase n=1 Tax=unclassified Mycoplasma TaxID=2683645 RepID=UPI00211C1C76|nr:MULTISPECIES: HAD family hydrolase [unclassified Mycoplasma]UUM19694.1 Cof-type HAD-IIB family hydrolase [Mycoplasma sp. 1578d]UUM24677.1 Cof-type HAD-IIB family hydrolase [Mycoplasma sp. 3686d]
MKTLEGKIKIAAFDVDGTLLPNAHIKFSQHTKEMFGQLRAKKIITVIATAREFATIGDFLEQLQPDYFIGSNGSFIWDVAKKEFIFKKTLIKEEVIQVYHHFKDELKGISISDFDKVFKSPQLKLDHWFVGPNAHNYVDFDEELLSTDNLFLITINKDNPHDLIQRINDYIQEHNLSMEVNSIWTRGLFILPKNINKFYTLNLLCQKLGINVQDLIAFGDGANDYEMIRDSGYGVAMERGSESLKQVAKDIAIDCEYDGVYLKLKELKII